MIRSFDGARAFALALCVTLVPALADAEDAPPPSSDPKEMARSLGAEALALHAAGQFKEAYAKFETAERIAHSPVFVVWMARSKRALGELRAAQRLYQRVVTESLQADSSANWQQAKAEAEVELKSLSARIPSIEVRLAGGSAVPSALELDGSTIAAATAIDVDPGEHVVRATGEGGAVVTQTVRVDEGQPREIVTIDLATGREPASTNENNEAFVVSGGILLGVGGLSLLAGAVTGAFALVLADEVEEGCVGNRCLASDKGKADDADALARASTGTLIAGGLLATAGIVLLVIEPGGSGRAAVHVGPTWAGLDVRF